MKSGSKAIAIVLLFVALVLVNYLATSVPLRVDATADDIYSLSAGSKAMLGKIEEPITLDLYLSENAEGLPVSYKNYGARVHEMLRQYARSAGGKLTLNVINPRSDTPEEEQATAAGLSPIPLGSGDQFFLGLVATQADQQKTIPTFLSGDPERPFSREPFLEYDLSKLIYSVQQLDKPKLGLLTSLPLQGSSPQEMQMMMMMRRQPQPGQFIVEEWKQSFDVVTIEPTATELPSNLDILVVAHPQNLPPKLQFAIDQFLLGGKPVVLALDPSSQHFKRQSNPQQMMMGGGAQNVSSDLPSLLTAYGIVYDAQKVVGDLENAAGVRTGTGTTTRYPVFLALRKPSFHADSMMTAELNTMVFIESGSIAPKEGTGLTFTPLVETSAQTGDLATMMLQFAQPDDIAKQITPSGKKTIAALVTGKFKTAFPDGPPSEASAKEGPPKEEPKPDESKDDAPKKDEPAPAVDALEESKGTSTLFVVADTDWLFDDYSVQKFSFFGQTAAQPINDNLAFASNAVEFLGGSQDLISIRGKGTSLRPFEVVRAMQVEANKKYQERLTALDARLQDVQKSLSELQGKKTEGNRLVASPEIAKAIDDYQKQSAALRGERRQIRRALTESIDALETKLLLANLLLTPLLLGVFGLWFYRSRSRKH